MAQLIDIAGEGLPSYLWAQSSQAGETVWDVGCQRARRETGGFSYRNASILECDGQIAAFLLGNPVVVESGPASLDGTPPLFVPLRQLEEMADGTWYINSLATYPQYRGRKFGSHLLRVAEEIAVDSGLRATSLIVADANEGARRLYERSGYSEKAALPMVKEQWINASKNWILMIKAF